MKTLGSVFLLLAGFSTAWSQGNTLELTNGQMLEWVALKDRGENVEVTTTGEVKTIRKTDIKRLLLVPPRLSVEKGNGKEVNLLAKVNVENDSIGGAWKLNAKGLSIVSDDPQAKLVFPVDVPDEYEINAVVERRGDSDWGGDFCFGLPAGGNQVLAVIDGSNGTLSGFEKIAGEGMSTNGASKGGVLFPRKGASRAVKIIVTKKILALYVDGKILVSCPPDYGKMSVDERRTIAPKNRLFLVTSKWGCGVPSSTWTLSRMTLVPRGEVDLLPPSVGGFSPLPGSK